MIKPTTTAEYRAAWEHDKHIASLVTRDEQWHDYAGGLLNKLEAAESKLNDARELDVYVIPMLDDNDNEVERRYVLADELYETLDK